MTGQIISANYDLILWGRNFKYVIIYIIFTIFTVIYQYSDTSLKEICGHDFSLLHNHIQICSKHVYVFVFLQIFDSGSNPKESEADEHSPNRGEEHSEQFPTYYASITTFKKCLGVLR